MVNLEFLSNDKLRSILERDKKEIEGCLKYGFNKCVLLLAGSTIEAILVDYLLNQSTKSEKEILKASLAELIDLAFELKLISKSSKDLSSVIRDYRNLIHPGKEYRERVKIDKDTASIANNLVNLIIDEISNNYAEKKFYSADQFLNKIRLDRSSPSLYHYWLSNMPKSEIIKLFRLIPDYIIKEYIIGPESSTWDLILSSRYRNQIEILIDVHNKASKKIPREVIIFELEKIYKIILSEQTSDALFYIRFFYDHLGFLDDAKLFMILEYLLDVIIYSINNNYGAIPLECLHEWDIYKCGKYLNNSKRENILISFLIKCVESPVNIEDNTFMAIINEMFMSINSDVIDGAIDKLSNYYPSVNIYQQRAIELVDVLRTIKDDLPF